MVLTEIRRLLLSAFLSLGKSLLALGTNHRSSEAAEVHSQHLIPHPLGGMFPSDVPPALDPHWSDSLVVVI